MGSDSSGFSAFGIWLRTVLADCGMKQRDLAKIMGKTETSVSRWVHGHRTPPMENLIWILDYFGYHIEIVPNEFKR